MDDVLNEAPCGFLSFADAGNVQVINTTLLLLLGYERGEVEGKPVRSLLSVGSRVFLQTHLFPLLKMQGRAEEIYLSLQTRGGIEVPILLNAVRRERDGITRYDCIIVPMRQRLRFEEELLQAKKAAEQANREKERAYTALAQAHAGLEEANVELEAQQAELHAQQEKLLELNAELAASAGREALFNRVGQVLRYEGEPQAALPVVATLVGEALGADRCYFISYKGAGDLVEVHTEWHRPSLKPLRGTYRNASFRRDVTALSGQDRLLISHDPQDTATSVRRGIYPTETSPLSDLKIRSQVAVAVSEDGEPIAALTVAMVDAPRAWTHEEITLLQEVATLIHLVTAEVRLREREHRIAEQLQEALQPKVPGRIPSLKLDVYYRAALSEANVGGDFYDVFPLEKGCYAFVVADLSGKGLQAAAQVAAVRHMLRAVFYERGTTIAQAVTRLNDMLTEHELLTGFATVFVGAYDVSQRSLTYVNAGQEPGLLWQAATRSIIQLGATGPVLGGFPGAVFQEQTVLLASGDVLALFTDGLTEAGRSRKEMLEIDGVSRIFATSVHDGTKSPNEMITRIMADVEQAVTPAGLKDDVCLLVIQME